MHRVAGFRAVVEMGGFHCWTELLHGDQFVCEVLLAHLVHNRTEHRLDVVALVKRDHFAGAELKLYLHFVEVVHIDVWIVLFLETRFWLVRLNFHFFLFRIVLTYGWLQVDLFRF